MVFQKLYNGFQDIDAKVLTFYRNYAEKWEARGHGSYGLPLLVTGVTPGITWGLDLTDVMLNITGFLLTTKEPENSMIADLKEYSYRRSDGEITFLEYHEKSLSRIAIGITAPFRVVAKRFYALGTPLPSDGLFKDAWRADPYVKALTYINRHFRLPMLAAGFGFLAKGIYGIGYSLATREPINYNEVKMDLSIAMGMLTTASSAYFKDGNDPKLGKKRKSLLQLAKEAWEELKKKASIKVPEPVTVGSKRSLEEIVAASNG